MGGGRASEGEGERDTKSKSCDLDFYPNLDTKFCFVSEKETYIHM